MYYKKIINFIIDLNYCYKQFSNIELYFILK